MPRKNIKPSGALWLLAFVLALPAGAAWAEGTFYVAPKIIIGRQKTSFEAPAAEIKRGSYSNPAYQPLYPGKYEGLGLAADDTNLFGALAVGADLYERLNLPLRLELEISMTGDAKHQGESVTIHESQDPNQTINGQRVNIDTQSVAYNMHTAFLNVYADWRNESRFTPYLGGGLGAAIIKGRATIVGNARNIVMEDANTHADLGGIGGIGNQTVDFENRAVNFAWHLDAGVSFNLTEKTAIDLGYRYLNVGKALSVDKDPHVRDPGAEYLNTEFWLYGPKEIKFEPTHQAVLSFRYSF